uniref:Fibronectin type III domain-containing protein n=1 Tax=Loa loa TaxID=7209 RepID=A0A1I7VVL9_LOALO
MEPIPEEDHEHTSFSPLHTVKHEKKSRLTEVYTSEQVDTLVSTVPQSALPNTWKLRKKDEPTHSIIPPTHLSEVLAGLTSARGSTYSCTYESHYDEPPDETSPDVRFPNKEHNGDIERHSSQTKKITRVTKVTTTRSVRHLPVTNQEAEYFFDADGSPLPVTRTSLPYEHDEDTSCRLDVAYDAPPPAPSSFHEAERYASRDVPSAPGVPEITDVTSYDVGLTWQCPDMQGSAGSVIGYQIEVREIGTSEWYLAHADLVKENRFRIKDLNPHIKYEIRVVAVNSAGRGVPSATSASVQLRLDYDFHSDFNGWRGAAPGRPYVLLLDSDRIVLEWAPAIANPGSAPVAGYEVSYRADGSGWIQSNDHLITTCRTEVLNLKPNGEYEFRVVAKTADGPSEPSLSSGFIQLKPPVPSRVPPRTKAESSFSPPGQPQIEELELNWVRLYWTEGGSPDNPPASYIVEYREIGDPLWYTATPAVCITSYTVECLRPNSTYEFRIIARAHDGSVSAPSAVSDVVQLRPSIKPGILHGVPAKPQPPEYVDFGSGDRVTLCWFPAASSLPVQGYDVEFRDHQQDAAWYKVNEMLIRSCKMTVGDLIPGHEYQFRVIACNSVGCSVPSDPSPAVHIGISYNGNDCYVEAASYGSIPLLQDEIVHESPPLPDRDDSPPPIRRKFLRERDVHWRDPTLREVIEYLDSANEVEQLNASGYLQHLTYNDNAIKEETRELDGIPKLVRLLGSDVPDIQKNVCGCLKNLSFGKENDENKRAINGAGGIVALAALLRQTRDVQVMEEVTATLWNLSSCDDLKPTILNQVSEPINQRIVIPGSGLTGSNAESGRNMSHSINMFKNGTGVLRNVSAASSNARKILRRCPGLIESFVHYLHHAVLRNQIDTRTVENVVCTLRNLSYRIQEVKDENYDPKADFETMQRERSKSAPSESPKNRKKESSKKKKIGQSTAMNGSESVAGVELLWQPQLVKLYLKLLQETSNPEILEASAGAIQNLAACHFEPSINVRACIRTEKGLPVLVELLRLNDDKVVCAVTTALRNLSLDQRNRELIGKYAMKDLVAKLPRADQQFRDPNVSDATIGAILGILFETVKHSADFTRNIHECGGTDRLRNLASSHPIYSTRICKYASQVLYLMWQHRELHDGFRRSGLKESDFYSGTTIRARDATTLSRPISSQGAERPTHLKNENLDDSASTYGAGRYDTLDSRASAPEDCAYDKTSPESNPQNLSLQTRNSGMHSFRSHNQAGEPLYASVHKRSERRSPTGGDSWV